MLKKGTHNSATGEKSYNWLYACLVPFARTQSKTIKEQYFHNCSCFDLRVKYYKNKLYIAHGLWISERTLEDVLDIINNFSRHCHVIITYEGKLDRKQVSKFKDEINDYKTEYARILYEAVNVKYVDNNITVDWVTIIPPNVRCPTEQAFLPLDGKHWQTYIPIPWLWKKFYFKNVEFNDKIYKLVDFL